MKWRFSEIVIIVVGYNFPFSKQPKLYEMGFLAEVAEFKKIKFNFLATGNMWKGFEKC